MSALIDRALAALDAGYSPVACHGKAPIFRDWQRGGASADDVRAWEADRRVTNIGILTGTVIGLDIDIADAALSERAKNLALQILGDTRLVRIGRAPRQLMVYRVASPIRKRIAAGTVHKVEVLGLGQQFVAWGKHPDTLQNYAWPEADLASVPACDVPMVTEEAIAAYLAALVDVIGSPPKPAPAPSPSPARGYSNGHDHGGQPDAADALEALHAIHCSRLDYGGWIKAGFALHAALGPSAAGHYEAWSATDPERYKAGEPTSKFRSFAHNDAIHAETLFWMAREHGWKPEREKQRPGVEDLGIFKPAVPRHDPETGEILETEIPVSPPPAALPRIHLRDIRSPLPPDKLIRKLLGTETLAMIYGPSGSGKSFLAMDMGLHIAMEREWFGRKVMKGAVLYVAAEGASGINNRIIGFKKKYTPEESTPFDLVPVSLNLGPNGQDADKVIAAVREMEAETGLQVLLIVIDTLARAMGNGDENTAKDMGEFIGHCDRIRQATRATILIVHHTGKNQAAGARGSSSLPAAVDTTIEVEVGDGGRVATIVKQKDGEDGVKFGFDLEVTEIGFDDDGEPITTCVVYTTDTIPKPSSKLSPQMRRAMEVLTSTIAQRNVQPPNRVDFPSVSVALLEHWRNELRETGITDRNDKDKERASFSRIRQTLDKKGFIRMRGEYVWKCETTETGRNKFETKK